MAYEFLEHTADVKFVAEGVSLEDTFEQAALALKEAVSGQIKVLQQTEKQIQLKGDSLENLLYKFLEEFLVLLDSECFLISSIKQLVIDSESFILKAKISGDSSEKYHFTNDVKAITYSELNIEKTGKGFRAKVVLDV